jgi:hypothetical protein
MVGERPAEQTLEHASRMIDHSVLEALEIFIPPLVAAVEVVELDVGICHETLLKG